MVTLLQEPNIRYLALENMTRLALVPEVLESIRGHQDMVLANLKVIIAAHFRCNIGSLHRPGA
jgi:hypothetical protein